MSNVKAKKEKTKFILVYEGKEIREYDNTLQLFQEYLLTCKKVQIYAVANYLDLYINTLLHNRNILEKKGVEFYTHALNYALRYDDLTNYNADDIFEFIFYTIRIEDSSDLEWKEFVYDLVRQNNVKEIPAYLFTERQFVNWLFYYNKMQNYYDKWGFQLSPQQERDYILYKYENNDPLDIKVAYKENEQFYKTYFFMNKLKDS